MHQAEHTGLLGATTMIFTDEETVNPVEFLKSQHREVEDLFTQIETTGEKAYKAKEQLFNTLEEKLTMHTFLEEKFFYPQMKDIDDTLALEAYEEHDAVKDLLKKIKKATAEDESFEAKIKFLKELIQHHVKEEENELFPKWEAEVDIEQLQQAGEKMHTAMEKGMPAKNKSTNKRQSSNAPSKKSKTARQRHH